MSSYAIAVSFPFSRPVSPQGVDHHEIVCHAERNSRSPDPTRTLTTYPVCQQRCRMVETTIDSFFREYGGSHPRKNKNLFGWSFAGLLVVNSRPEHKDIVNKIAFPLNNGEGMRNSVLHVSPLIQEMYSIMQPPVLIVTVMKHPLNLPHKSTQL